MVTKPSTNDGFGNPLYDELLEFFDRNVRSIAETMWGRDDWTHREISKIDEAYRSPIPDRPNVVVHNVRWQHTLKMKKRNRDGSLYDAKTVDSGIVDLSISLDLPYLEGDWRNKQAVAKMQRYHLHLLCRPILKSVASTIRTLNELRDRETLGLLGEKKEMFGIITCNAEPADIFRGQGYFFFDFDEDDMACTE